MDQTKTGIFRLFVLCMTHTYESDQRRNIESAISAGSQTPHLYPALATSPVVGIHAGRFACGGGPGMV